MIWKLRVALFTPFYIFFLLFKCTSRRVGPSLESSLDVYGQPNRFN